MITAARLLHEMAIDNGSVELLIARDIVNQWGDAITALNPVRKMITHYQGSLSRSRIPTRPLSISTPDHINFTLYCNHYFFSSAENCTFLSGLLPPTEYKAPIAVLDRFLIGPQPCLHFTPPGSHPSLPPRPVYRARRCTPSRLCDVSLLVTAGP